MSRFHSLPNTHRSISKEELESLKALYPSSSSLPIGTGYFHDTIVLHHDDNHTRLGATDSTSETTMSCISEAEELGSREVEDSDEATSDEGTESGHKVEVN